MADTQGSQSDRSDQKIVKILVVDDEEAVRKLFRLILVGEGFEVTLAADGAIAMRAAKTQVFDVVITDLVMPEREGIETIQALRDNHPEVKIIAISGAFGGSFLTVAQRMGANATLLKPVSPAQLVATVRSLLPLPE